MDFSIWADASLVIKLHTISAVVGLLIGAFVLARHKGGRLHKLTGRIFAIATSMTAFSSFFIHEINLWGRWSAVHLISIFVIWSVGYAIWAIRNGKRRSHESAMVSLYVSGFIIAGSLTFLPDRMMFDIFLAPMLGDLSPADGVMDRVFSWLVPAVAIVVAIIAALRLRRHQTRPGT